MMLKRLAYLGVKEESYWASCRDIEHALRASYQGLFPESFRSFDFSIESPDNWEDLISDIVAFMPDVIVFGDVRIKLNFWGEKISFLLNNKCRWVIHTYGCILTRQDEIVLFSRALRGQELILVTASKAHQQILQKFFLPSSSVIKIPFPVNVSGTDSLKTKGTWRKNFGLNSDCKLFISAGRISMNKNIHQLIELFSEYHILHPDSALIICGAVDFQSTLNFNLTNELFNYHLELARSKGCPVFYVGQLPKGDLISLMQDCNALISLSTNIGEDFGLVAAEALAVGLPVILSNWGGHRDFNSNPLAFLVELEVSGGRIQLDKKNLFIQMELASNNQSAFKLETDCQILPQLRETIVQLAPVHEGMTPQFIAYAKKLSFRSPMAINPFFQDFADELYPYWR